MTGIKPKILPITSFLIAVLILFYKRPDAFYNPQFWAEEGSVFFAEAYHHGFKSIFNTCLGYFHVYPRLVFLMGLAVGIPMGGMTFLCTYTWLFMFVLLLIYIWNRIELDAAKKFFIALSTVLIPLQAEVFMNLTNVQWIMALFPMIIFSCTDTKKNKKWFWLDFVLLFLSAFTGPNVLVLSPIVLYVFLKERTQLLENKKRLILLLFTLLAAMVSLFSLLNYGTVSRTYGLFDPLNQGFVEYLYVQFAFLFFGDFAYHTPWPFQVLVVLLVTFSFFYVLIKLFKGQIWTRFQIFVFFSGVLFMFATLYSFRFNPGILDPRFGAIRNFYIPAVCVCWFLISGIKSGRNTLLIGSAFSVLLFYESLTCIGREEFIDYNWPYFSKQIVKTDSLIVPINPPGWQLRIDNSKKEE